MKKKKSGLSNMVVLAVLKKKAAPTMKKLKRVEKIATIKEYNVARDQMKVVKAIVAEAVKEEKSMLSGIKQTEQRIKEFFAPFKEDVANLEESIKNHMSDFIVSQQKLKEKIEAKVESGKMSVAKYTENLGEMGGIKGSKNIKQLVIEDEKKIPREYMVPDEKKIKEALLAGEEVPGCVLGTKQTIAI